MLPPAFASVLFARTIKFSIIRYCTSIMISPTIYNHRVFDRFWVGTSTAHYSNKWEGMQAFSSLSQRNFRFKFSFQASQRFLDKTFQIARYREPCGFAPKGYCKNKYCA